MIGKYCKSGDSFFLSWSHSITKARLLCLYEEFDNSKEVVMWEGSNFFMLSSDEQRFLEASVSYVSGNPIMSEEKYDKMKMKLNMD
ncbi:hypothetical protein Bca4012_019783 [Brassica carinata]